MSAAAISAPVRCSPAMPTVLPTQLAAALEDAVGALADVLGRDARQLLVAHREGDASVPSGPLFGPMPK